jgi:hypothetical protein
MVDKTRTFILYSNCIFKGKEGYDPRSNLIIIKRIRKMICIRSNLNALII